MGVRNGQVAFCVLDDPNSGRTGGRHQNSRRLQPADRKIINEVEQLALSLSASTEEDPFDRCWIWPTCGGPTNHSLAHASVVKQRTLSGLSMSMVLRLDLWIPAAWNIRVRLVSRCA
jgi:hypothetical protein